MGRPSAFANGPRPVQPERRDKRSAIARKSAAFRLAPPTSAPSTLVDAPAARRRWTASPSRHRGCACARPRRRAARQLLRGCAHALRRRRRRSASGRCRSPRPARRRSTVSPACAAAGTEPASCRDEHVERPAGLALGAASRRCRRSRQPGPPRGLGLGPHHGIGLAVIGAPLGMADDHMAGAGVLQHLGRDVAGMGAARRWVAILAAALAPAAARQDLGGPRQTASPAGRAAPRSRRRDSLVKRRANGVSSCSEAPVPFIFQLPATSGRIPGVMPLSRLPTCAGSHYQNRPTKQSTLGFEGALLPPQARDAARRRATGVD